MSQNEELVPYSPSTLPLKKLQWAYFDEQLRKTRAALRRFDKLLNTIPQSETLLSSLSVLEALAALESQKIHLSLEDFFLLRKKKLFPLIYYHRALREACRSIRSQPVNKKMVCGIHRLVKKGAPNHMEVGKYRTEQNWIGPEGCKREEAYFFPPAPKKVASYMHNLIEYTNRKAKDPLVQIALSIAQFLVIHPFRDGNGRVGRILVPLLLYKKGALSYPLLFKSRYLKDYRNKYFRKLFDITEKNRWEQWVRFFLHGIASAARDESKIAKSIYRLFLKTGRLTFLFSHPVFTRAQFLKRHSLVLFNELKALKIIKPLKRYYVFTALLRLLKTKPRKGKPSRG